MSQIRFEYEGRPLSEKVPLIWAIKKIPGLGFSRGARLIESEGLDPESKWLDLGEEDRLRLVQAIGRGSHDNFEFGKAEKVRVILDVRALVRRKCYRGMRHKLGMRVRGQRTRTTNRKNKIIKGFQKKDVKKK